MKRQRTAPSLVVTAVAIVVVVVGSASAHAYRTGRIDFSGRVNSCLACHGPSQGPGLTFTLENVNETEPCAFEDDEGTLVSRDLPLLTFGARYPAVVHIDAPAEPNAPVCPTNNCCDAASPPAEGAECLHRPGARGGPMVCSADDFLAECCEPDLNNCALGAQGGFNAEVVAGDDGNEVIPGGELVPPAEEADSQLLKRAGDDVTSQITHTVAKAFSPGRDDNGALLPYEPIEWRFEYVAPAEGAVAFAPQVWVGATIGNGNNLDDKGDLNSSYRYDTVLTDGAERFVYPAYCRICEDGRSRTNCCACSASSERAGNGYLAFAALSALGLLFTRRPRRR